MPRINNGNVGKAKDFKGSIKRLVKELNQFKFLLIISLVLAVFGAILTIFTPNILSNLTDKIKDGLVVNADNITLIFDKISENVDKDKLVNVIKYDLSDKNIDKIMELDYINDSDKDIFNEFISSKDKNIFDLPVSILNEILVDNDNISVSDQISFINIIKSNDNIIFLPNNIIKLTLKDINVDGSLISVSDQLELINIVKETNGNNDLLYGMIDSLPDSIYDVIKPKMDMNSIKNLTIILVCMYLCSAIFTYIQAISMTDIANKFAKKLRTDIALKINRLPLSFFDRNTTGDILSRVTNDIDIIAQSMNQSLATLVSSVTLFFGTLIMMFITNPIMAITSIVSSFIGFVIMFIILMKSQKYFEQKQRELGNLNGHIEEIYSGLNVVKTYNGRYLALDEFNDLNKKLCNANRKSQFLSGLMHPIMAFIGNFGYVAVCIVGALLVMNNKITFGVIIAFISYVRLFTSPLSQIGQSMTNVQNTAAAGERIFEFLDEREMSDESNKKKHLDRKDVKGKIEFKNVSFKYEGNENSTIHNFSAVANRGKKVAIVGPTGAGKTTIVNLLMKFYEISSGDILIDGVSINDLTRENVHDLFTMVLQDTWIYEGTVKENIVFNQKNVTDKKIKEICKIVGIDHFIKTLSNGYDTILNNNESVSAGQKQLLTIARGMIKDAPFLILDEATSNVDTRTEELVQNAMDKLSEGKTSFIIAHRLSTIKNADLILVMKDGNIIEQGTHDELIKLNKFYSKLYNSQFKL